MRLLAFVFIITLSQYSIGQNVFSKFTDTLVSDNFETNRYTFPQKYTAAEISIIENGQYRIKRLSDDGRSISYLKQDKALYAGQINTTLEILKGSSMGGGLVLSGQSTGNGAIFLEVKNKCMFRVYKIYDEQWRLLSGSPKSQGWNKSKSLHKSGPNDISVRMEDGYYDIYFNGKFAFTAFDTQFESGKVGIFANSGSEILATNFSVLKKGNSLPGTPSTPNTNTGAATTDPNFQEVILIFKTKIDQQQLELATLQREVDRCKSMLNYDTSLVTRSQDLQSENKLLAFKLDSTTKELNRGKKRLEYLESMKEDVEKGSNGDLVLSLTTILAEVKRENQDLKTRAQAESFLNTQLKKDNEVLLREIDRLKYMLDLKE